MVLTKLSYSLIKAKDNLNKNVITKFFSLLKT